MHKIGSNVTTSLEYLINKVELNPELENVDNSRYHILIGHVTVEYHIDNKKMRLKYINNDTQRKTEVVYDPGMDWIIFYDDIHIPSNLTYSVAQRVNIKNISKYFDKDELQNSDYTHLISTKSLREFFLLYEIMYPEFILKQNGI